MVLFGINTTTTPVSPKSWDCISTSSFPTLGLDGLRGNIKYKVDLTLTSKYLHFAFSIH